MDFLHFSDRFTKNQDEPIPAEAMHVARCFKEEGRGFPAMRGCWLAQIMTQHYIQTIVPQSPGDLLGRGAVIRITPQSTFNWR
jgi:hypothetical protein